MKAQQRLETKYKMEVQDFNKRADLANMMSEEDMKHAERVARMQAQRESFRAKKAKEYVDS